MGSGLKASSLDWPSALPRNFSADEIRDCETNPAASNSYSFNHPPIEEALECIQTEIDPDARLECIYEVQQVLYDQHFPIYVWNPLDIYAVGENLGGIDPTPSGAMTTTTRSGI